MNRVFHGWERRQGTAMRLSKVMFWIILQACFLTGCSMTQTYTLALAPDRNIAAAGQNYNRVTLYDADTLQVKRSLATRTDASRGDHHPRSLIFSPDGRHLAALGPDDAVIAWDISSGREALRLGPMKDIAAVAFSPDGKALALAGPGKEGRLVRFPGGEEMAVFAGHENGLSSVAFSPAGKLLATGSRDGTVRLWDIRSVKTVAICPGIVPVRGVSFSRDGRVLATASFLDARLWHAASDGSLERLADPGYVRSPRAVVYAGSELLELADTFSMEDRPFAAAQKTVNDSRVGYSPDGRFLAFFSRSILMITDLKTRKKVSSAGMVDFAFRPDGKLLSASDFGVMILDPETGRITRQAQGSAPEAGSMQGHGK